MASSGMLRSGVDAAEHERQRGQQDDELVPERKIDDALEHVGCRGCTAARPRFRAARRVVLLRRGMFLSPVFLGDLAVLQRAGGDQIHLALRTFARLVRNDVQMHRAGVERGEF